MRRSRPALVLLFALFGCRNESNDYRHITPVDLCMERDVYLRPEPGALAGRLLDEIDDYSEKANESPRAVIGIRTTVDGHLRDVWREKDVVLSWYVRADSRNDDCRWIASPQPWRPGAEEIAASKRIRLTGPASWQSVPEFSK